MGIRFISVNDHYDSDNHKGQTAPLDVAFGTIMHDVYSKELSDKVRQTYVTKTKNGEFLCGCPPFGFVKSDSGKNRLVVDNEAADTVRRIFALACDGNSNTQIAVALNSDGVDTPLMYRKRKGRTLRGAHSAAAERVFWTSESVRKILIDERYTGVMVSGKKRVSSPGSHRRDYLPESEWIRVPGSHEAIVSEEVFKQANAHIRHYKIASPTRNRSPFTGKIKCGCCGKSMQYVPAANPYFFCESPRFNGGTGCFESRVYLSELSKVVLTIVKVEAHKVFDTLRQRKNQTHAIPRKKEINAELNKLSARVALLERRNITLFEELADEKIDKDTFLAAMMAANDEELHKAKIRSDDLNRQLASFVEKQPSDLATTESALQQVLDAEEVTDMILSLIDSALIFDNEHIEVRFAFGDTNITP